MDLTWEVDMYPQPTCTISLRIHSFAANINLEIVISSSLTLGVNRFFDILFSNL